MFKGHNTIKRHTQICESLCWAIHHECRKEDGEGEIDSVILLAKGGLGDMAVVLAAAEMGDDLTTTEKVQITLAAQEAAVAAVRATAALISIDRDYAEREFDGSDPTGHRVTI